MNTNQLIITPEAIAHNYKILQSWAGGDTHLMAVIKSDAYGHGIVPTATALTEAGCHQFAVFDTAEALYLREKKFTQPILVLKGFDPEDMDKAIVNNLTSVLFRKDTAEQISQAAQALGTKANVQIKIDTGMNRLGVYPQELTDFMQHLKHLHGIRVNGFISHFAVSDQPDDKYTHKQMQTFQDAISHVKDQISHIANSGGIISRKGLNYPVARAGIAIYGSSPDPDWELASQLEPAMRLISQVLHIKTVPPNETISYGRTYKTQHSARIATLPVGYANGYNRQLSNKACVLIHGKRAPVVGRVCMNLIMVDVSHIPNIHPGTPVVLLGKQLNDYISADEMAAWANTISYEIMCLMGACNERIYCD